LRDYAFDRSSQEVDIPVERHHELKRHRQSLRCGSMSGDDRRFNGDDDEMIELES
jgi:hypothetical protein